MLIYGRVVIFVACVWNRVLVSFRFVFFLRFVKIIFCLLIVCGFVVC